MAREDINVAPTDAMRLGCVIQSRRLGWRECERMLSRIVWFAFTIEDDIFERSWKREYTDRIKLVK